MTRAHRSTGPETSHPPSIQTIRSTNRLNIIVNGSWLKVSRILDRSLMIAHWMTMKAMYTMRTVVPRDIPSTLLRTLGSDTMGDAPMDAFTVMTTPKDMTNTETTISRRSFLKVGLLVTGVLVSGFPMGSPP